MFHPVSLVFDHHFNKAFLKGTYPFANIFIALKKERWFHFEEVFSRVEKSLQHWKNLCTCERKINHFCTVFFVVVFFKLPPDPPGIP